MKKILIAASALAAVLTACNNRSENSDKELAQESNEAKFDTKAGEANARFVVDAVSSNSTEVNLAQLAMQRSANAEVKELAAMLEKDHTAMVNELRNIADQKAITTPVELTEDARKKHQELSDAKPEDFDRKWAREMADKHEKTIDKYEKALNNTTDTEIRQWIESALPKVKAHYEQVKALRDKLG